MLIRTSLVAVALGFAVMFAPEAAQAQTPVVVINPETNQQAQAICDRNPPKKASKGWLIRHCEPRGSSMSPDSFFDVFTEIELP